MGVNVVIMLEVAIGNNCVVECSIVAIKGYTSGRKMVASKMHKKCRKLLFAI